MSWFVPHAPEGVARPTVRWRPLAPPEERSEAVEWLKVTMPQSGSFRMS
jgi:hypothetical protein